MTNETTNEGVQGIATRPMSEAAWKTFSFQPIADQHVQLIDDLKQEASYLWDVLDALQLHPNATAEVKRYFAVAKTELETSVMWAVKGVSRIPGSATKTNAA